MQEKREKNLMIVQMSADRLKEIMEQCATLGAMHALRAAGVGTCEWKTRAELVRLYGKHAVTQAIKAGLPSKSFGKREKYSTIEFNNLVIR